MEEKILETGQTLTLAGTYIENVIHTDKDERFKCCTYGSLRERIEGRTGIFNLKYEASIKDWVIFQYMQMEI